MTSNVQVSAKLTDGRIFVIGGDTVLDFQNNLIELLGAEGAGDLMDTFKMALGGLASPMEMAVQNVQVFSQAAPQAAPSPAVSSPDGPKTETDKWSQVWTYGKPEAPSCPHGQRVFKAATSKAGKAYTAWVCPTQSPSAYRQQITADKSCALEFVGGR